MGQFTAIGMRQKVDDPTALIINTCANNDTTNAGHYQQWAWCNPTNQIVAHPYHDITAISVECLWQGTKLRTGQTQPDQEVLDGNWRKNKGKCPVGAYAGPGLPLITTPGEARRTIYIPAYRRLVDHWINTSEEVFDWVVNATNHKGNVYLRDHDTGRGLDRNGPMSHAWLLAMYLNTLHWPD